MVLGQLFPRKTAPPPNPKPNWMAIYVYITDHSLCS